MTTDERETLDAILRQSAFPVGSDAGETPVTAFIDLVGDGYVELALEFGIARDRIDTIVDFPSVQKYAVKFEGGAATASAATLAELAEGSGWRHRRADPTHLHARRGSSRLRRA